MAPLHENPFKHGTHAAGRDSTMWEISSHGPGLRERGILCVGYNRVGPGYHVSRQHPSFSNINITLGGRGQALIDGQWKRIEEGTAILSPRDVPHASRLETGMWEFCYVCFEERNDKPPRLALGAPTLAQVDPHPFGWTVRSLLHEYRATPRKRIFETLLGLLDLYLDEVIVPDRAENRLWRLWEAVTRHPEAEWTVAKMAAQAGVGARQLLRLCREETGRNLQEQLVHLRMGRAASLLQVSDLKLQVIAEAVGYRDAFAFSKAFKKWSGAAPSIYRNEA